MKKYLILGGFLAAGIALVTVQSSSALLDFSARSQAAEQRAEEGRVQAAQVRENIFTALNATRAETLDEKRAEIKQRVQERRAEVKEKLSGQRAEACKQKEQGINQALSSRTAVAERYLTKFKVVQERLTTFASENQLTIENEATYIDVMNARHDDAAAIMGAAGTTVFTCIETSAENPGEVVKVLVHDTKTALEKYRSAIKDYAEVVKTAAKAKSGQSEAQGE